MPEVALAPQTVGRVRARFEARGIRTVVWHSHLSAGERYDAWHALASGEARVVVGARSAVFAPVRNLRLLIVDEEHEPAYKQDEAPRYNGRDVAVYRARLSEAVCVLASATPSLESLHNVTQGKYAIDRILKRVDDRSLPRIHVVDMRGNMPPTRPSAPFPHFLPIICGIDLRKKSRAFCSSTDAVLPPACCVRIVATCRTAIIVAYRSLTTAPTTTCAVTSVAMRHPPRKSVRNAVRRRFAGVDMAHNGLRMSCRRFCQRHGLCEWMRTVCRARISIAVF